MYYMPTKKGLLTAYYFGANRQLRMYSGAKLKKLKRGVDTPEDGGVTIRPVLKPVDDMCLAMASNLVANMISAWKLPRGPRNKRPSSNFQYLTEMWVDIMDRYFGVSWVYGDNSEQRVDLHMLHTATADWEGR